MVFKTELLKPFNETSLYIVPTPIGNLGDITYRAVDVLKQVDVILAEDTRVTKKLLTHYGIQTSLQSYHNFNEHKTSPAIVARLEQGETIALVSDAGTPGISDPGFLLVRMALENQLKVEVLPGPSALITALVGSGLPSDRFVFEGFLPPKKGRLTKFRQLSEESCTMVFYESPHRILKTLQQMSEHFGPEREVVVARELSKVYETYHRGTIAEIVAGFAEKKPKGEMVLIVKGVKSKKQ